MSDTIPTPGFFAPEESTTAFPPTSRYAATATARTTLPDGRIAVHLRRRFIPEPSTLSEIGSVITAEGDRLDLIVARVYGQAELDWRIADANRGFDPVDLVAAPGRRLRITLPGANEQGGSNA
jgi:nucleoid-associated protein YgaU